MPEVELRRVVAEILTSFGESPEGAEWVAGCLVKADMRGITTHGTYLLKPVAERVKVGMLDLPTRPELIAESGATVLIDGKNGLGPVAAKAAVEACVEKAKKFGVGMALVRNTNNVGSLACYTEFVAEQDMAAVVGCNAAPSMAPWGGAEAFVGTNPLAISFPVGTGYCFTADMASSVVARGKIRKALRQNEKIPASWALDKNGTPTTDPGEALQGTLLPVGGPKGSALALAIDIVSGLLAGSAYGPALKSFHAPEGPTGVGFFCLVFDVGRFMPVEHFKKLLGEYIDSAKGVKKAAGFSEILMPGELERRREQSSKELGVEVDAQTLGVINSLLKEINSQNRLGGASDFE
ncbi:MAG: Ldh family oxidoreductase [Desulfotomaculales bacterium]